MARLEFDLHQLLQLHEGAFLLQIVLGSELGPWPPCRWGLKPRIVEKCGKHLFIEAIVIESVHLSKVFKTKQLWVLRKA